MTRSAKILTIVFGLVVLLLSMPATGAAQEAVTAEISRLHPMTSLGQGLTDVASDFGIGPADEAPAAELLPAPVEESAGAEQGLDIGDALVAIGGALVAGALADYVASPTRWGITAPQAGAFGGGALLAVVGGFRFQ